MDVVAYVIGRTHQKPLITDDALEEATIGRRRQRYHQLFDAHDSRVLDFPEFQSDRRVMQFEDRIITAMQSAFDLLIRKIPEFQAIVEEHPFTQPKGMAGRSLKKRRKKARNLWKRRMIQKFVAADRRAIEKMLEARGWDTPWWRNALWWHHQTQDEAFEPLAVAA